MSDSVTTLTQLNGWYKKKYASKLQDPIPEVNKFATQIGPLVQANKIGKDFNFPVELALPQGTTYAAAGAGAFAFEETIPGEMKEATIDGSQMVVSDIIDYESVAKSINGQDSAYGDAVDRLRARMRKAGQKRLELAMWYGQNDIGVVSSATQVSGAQYSLLITTASWASGIWTGMKGMRFQIYDTTLGSQRGTATTGFFRVDKVQISLRTIVATGFSSSGTSAAGEWSAVIATDRVVPFHSVGNDMAGVVKIVSNTGSLFGIDAGTYELWAGNSFGVGSVAFTLKKLNDAIADAVGKGLDGKATVWVSTRTWANLCADQAALRRFDASYSSNKLTNGTRTLSMFSQNGELEIMPHTVVKEGEAYILPMDSFMKVGAYELGASIPGRGEYFDNAINSSGQSLAGFRLMHYAHQAIIGVPGKMTRVTGIVNS